MSEREIKFINSIISGNTTFADNLMASVTKDELMDLCFTLSESYGLLLVFYLCHYFSETKSMIILETIISLLVTEFSHWEGKDFLEISLLKKANIFFPESIFVLDALLVFAIPPYIKGAFDSFVDFNSISANLYRLCPENETLKSFLLLQKH